MESAEYNQNVLSLEDITGMYNIVLVDTSALFRPLNSNGVNGNGNRNFVPHSAEFFVNYFRDRSNLYVTNLILHEFDPKRSGYFPIGSYRDLEWKGASRERTRFIGDHNREIRERSMLVSAVEGSEGIIQLSQKEWKLYARIDDRVRKKAREYRLSDTDRDLLVTAAAITRTRGPSAIVSNDFGILKLGMRLFDSGRLKPGVLGLFSRESIEGFKKYCLE